MQLHINNKSITLDPSQLIQSGGEGMVFGLGDTAVKLYHQPTPQQATKIGWMQRAPLLQRLPANVLKPCAIATAPGGDFRGYQMKRLPTGSQPLKRLSQPGYQRKFGMSTTAVLALLLAIYDQLAAFHQQGIVVGDLNDHNLFFSEAYGQLQPWWLDVDSYQVDRFPCPVAAPAFLEPSLYGVADFSQRPYFSPTSDWYAYAVLLVKCLLQTHPYGGTHHQYKTLSARATARVSVWQPTVTYPHRATPTAVLSPALEDALRAIFDGGRWPPVSRQLLVDYANNLAACGRCGLSFDQRHAACPGCQQQPAAPPVATAALPAVDGFIELAITRPNGRSWVISYEGNTYSLYRGRSGRFDKLPLFTGKPGYRFGLFGQTLVVNPPGQPQLLLLAIDGDTVTQLGFSTTALLGETAVFATTPHALYRIAGGWILRGAMQNGTLLESQLMTAHDAQTTFVASPYADEIAGYHRVFGDFRFFHAGGNGRVQEIALPTPLHPVTDATLTFTRHHLHIERHLAQPGQTSTEQFTI